MSGKKLNILFLNPRFPYPLMSGDRVKSFYLLKHLSENHNVTLLSFYQGAKIDENFDIIFQSKDISGQFYEKFKTKRDFLVRQIKNKFKPTEKYLIAQKIFDEIINSKLNAKLK